MNAKKISSHEEVRNLAHASFGNLDVSLRVVALQQLSDILLQQKGRAVLATADERWILELAQVRKEGGGLQY